MSIERRRTYTVQTIPGLTCHACSKTITTPTMVYDGVNPHTGQREFYHPACYDRPAAAYTPPAPIGRSREGYVEHDPRGLYDRHAHEED
ncbi:MAG TPA: hypothetical protein VF406_04625 [Thermodesulfobacteriota bacterium]